MSQSITDLMSDRYRTVTEKWISAALSTAGLDLDYVVDDYSQTVNIEGRWVIEDESTETEGDYFVAIDAADPERRVAEGPDITAVLRAMVR